MTLGSLPEWVRERQGSSWRVVVKAVRVKDCDRVRIGWQEVEL